MVSAAVAAEPCAHAQRMQSKDDLGIGVDDAGVIVVVSVSLCARWQRARQRREYDKREEQSKSEFDALVPLKVTDRARVLHKLHSEP